MTQRAIIAFTGPIGCGKTTAAKALTHRGWARIRFAETLKAMGRSFGLSDAQLDGDEKEVPSELLCGKTPRQFMQWLGTDFGRKMIGDDVWIRAWARHVEQTPAYIPVVVDDVRFENEANAVRALGGIVVRVLREGCGSDAHASEQFDWKPDRFILNAQMETFTTDAEIMGNVLRRERGV